MANTGATIVGDYYTGTTMISNYIDYMKKGQLLCVDLTPTSDDVKKFATAKKTVDMPRRNTAPAYDKNTRMGSYPFGQIVRVTVLKKDKVVEVEIQEDSILLNTYSYKQVCREPDVFDMKYALSLALVKFGQRNAHKTMRLTPEGIENAATDAYMNLAYFRKEVDRAYKAYLRWEKEEEKRKKLEEEEKVAKARKEEKRRQKKAMKAIGRDILIAKAREMKANGDSVHNIAVTLNIPESVVRYLIKEE